MTTSTGATAPPTCSSSSTPTAPGARSRSPTVGPAATSPSACAIWSTSTIPRRRRSAWCWITCQPTRPARSTRPFPRARRAGCCAAWSFTSRPSTRVGCNMVEIEIGVLRTQCLDRRIAERERLEAEIAAWQRRRNAEGARINWMFTTDQGAREDGPCISQPAPSPRPSRA